MKIYKLQRDFLKAMTDRVFKKSDRRLLHQYDEDEEVHYISDSYKIFVIDDSYNFLDYKYCENFDIKGVVESNNKDLKDLYDVQIIDINENTKVRLLKADGLNVWVDEKFFKYFDKEIKYKTSGNERPVYCYEEEKLVSVLLPTRYDKKIDLVRDEK